MRGAKRGAGDVYGLHEPSAALPAPPWLRRRRTEEKFENDDTPSEARIVVEHFARELQRIGLPGLVPRSLIDGTLEDRTAVQQQLEELGPETLRTFRIQNELMYALTRDYEAALRSQLANRSDAMQPLIERFITRVVRRHRDPSITTAQLGYLVVCGLSEVPANERARKLTPEESAQTERLVTVLFELGAVVRHAQSTSAYWLHYPNAGALCRQLVAHRTEAQARLKRARWNELLESDVIGRGCPRVLRGVRVELPLDALGADLVGRGIAQRIRTTGGLYYRVPRT